jgi:hypothetical protein
MRFIILALWCLLTAPTAIQAQSKLYLDLKVGINHNAAEGVYFDKRRLPFKPYSTLKDMMFDEQGVAMLRLQINEKLGVATGYSGSALAWGYSLQMPQQYTLNPYHGEWRGRSKSAYMHQLPLLVNRTLGEYNIREIDTVRHTYLTSFRLDAVFGGGANRIGNNCLDCGGFGGGGIYDTIEFKETYIVRHKWGGFLTGGVTARFYRLGKERLNLSLFYTQGLTDMLLVPVAYQYNSQRGSTTLRIRGSGFSATLGLPIRLKTFRKAPPD